MVSALFGRRYTLLGIAFAATAASAVCWRQLELADYFLVRTGLGQTVRKLRRQQNLTIAEIARKAQISSGMLSKIENSQTSASLDTLASLADALGTTLASLFTGFSSEEGGAQHVKSGHAPEVVRRGTRRGHTYHLLAIERGPRRVFEPFLVTLSNKSEIFPGFEHPGIETSICWRDDCAIVTASRATCWGPAIR